MDGDASWDFLNQCRETFVTAFHLLQGSTASCPAACTSGDVSFAPRNRVFPLLPPSLPISRCPSTRERERSKEEQRTRDVINLSAKRPRTSEASFRISQMRPWFSADIPYRYRRRLSLISRVICPSLSILGRYSTCLKAGEHLWSPVFKRNHEPRWSSDLRSRIFILSSILLITLYLYFRQWLKNP